MMTTLSAQMHGGRAGRPGWRQWRQNPYDRSPVLASATLNRKLCRPAQRLLPLRIGRRLKSRDHPYPRSANLASIMNRENATAKLPVQLAASALGKRIWNTP
jgi:hypothetical protein